MSHTSWKMPRRLNRKMLFVLGAVMFCCVRNLHAEKKDNCEYDMDLTKNVIKITCEGAPSRVNVYAETAHVSGDDDVDVDVTSNNERSKVSNYRSSSRRRSNKELRKGGKQQKETGRMSADRGHEQQFDFSDFESAFSNVVWNTTQKLDDAKQKLLNYVGSLKNISNQLQEGDFHLRNDMDNLREIDISATELKEGIIVTMKNQYNFMRSALLTHNYELKRVMDSLHVLVDVTSVGLNSALNAHKTSMTQIGYLNRTLTAVKNMVTTELRKRQRRMRVLKKGNNSRECPKEISAIGSGFPRKVDAQIGAFMFESYTPNVVTSVWTMTGSEENDQLMEYDTAVDIDHKLVARYYALPYSCRGTGHAVFRRHFYCHKPGSNAVMKYHLKSMDIVSEVILTGSYISRFPYKSRQSNTDVDLAVDEMGLWAIYASEESHGKLIITKINHKKMEVEKTWVTPYLKTDVGNAVMICGVLYATDSATDVPTFIRYMYNTENSQGRVLEPGQLPFSNSAELHAGKKSYRSHHSSNSVMLSYDFRMSMLYSWSNYKIESFPVYFKDPSL